MSILDDIAKLHGTDKSSEVHDYCRKYEKYLPFKREEKLKILEIGVFNGQSLKMWKDYFYQSIILGIDIEPNSKQYEEERIVVEVGSQSDGEFLSKIINQYEPFDMILDDGSHQSSDIIYSFEHLFNHVKSGGVYIVEDVVTSYWPSFNGGIRKEGTAIEYFKNIVDDVNFFGELLEEIDPQTNTPRMFPDTDIIIGHGHRKDDGLIEQFKRKKFNFIGTSIESINFLNSIIIITKR